MLENDFTPMNVRIKNKARKTLSIVISAETVGTLLRKPIISFNNHIIYLGIQNPNVL